MKARTGMRQNKQKRKPLKTTHVIGLTGGIGAGKSDLAEYLKANYQARVFSTDEIGEEVVLPGGMCYSRLRDLLPKEAFDRKGIMDREVVSKLMYEDPSLRKKMNDLIHPAVGIYLTSEVKNERERGLLDFVIIESALYDGTGFATLCDEVWNVDAPKEQRLQRLMESRGYSREKAEGIFESQAKYDRMRRGLKVQIDNSGSREEAYAQLDQQMERVLPGSKRKA